MAGRAVVIAALAACAAPAMAQQAAPPAVPKGRADENVVRQAQDAFGSTIGRETIGIYSSSSVRGFSPIAAGNARIDGLYYDQVTPPNSRIRRSTSIKIGLSAQGYAFPAPTGVVDYALRRPGSEALLSTTLAANSFGEKTMEVDAELPIDGDRLSVGIGAGLFAHAFANGSTSRQHVEGLTVRWRPAPSIEILPFFARSDIYDDEVGPQLVTAGPYLPPRIRRGVFYGPKWATEAGTAQLFGVRADIGLGNGWSLAAGVYRSSLDQHHDTYPYLTEITPDGRARYLVFSDPPFARSSVSGEVRLTHVSSEGPRTHSLSVSARARDRRERIGGSTLLDFGPVRLGDPLRFAKPPVAYGAQNRDQIHQTTLGVAYAGRWQDVGEISLGLSRSDYAKDFRRLGRPDTRTHDRPWLYNVAAAAYLTDRLALYAGYTRGLEETGLPPQNAANRNQALPAILTSQREAGVRWRVAGDVKLVAGVFDVRKPYLSLDPANVFTTLGQTRNRGVEASLSGTPVKGLSVALGGVLLDPQVVGEARDLGRTGKRPVGVPLRSVNLNADWIVPGLPGFSLDAGVTELGRIASTVGNTLFVPGYATASVGGRYRFQLGKAKATLRVQVQNLFDRYALAYQGPGSFDYIAQRQVNAYLAVDL